MTDKVLDFVKKRKESVEEKRRAFERILFDNLLGVYTVLDNAGSIYPVKLVDISREGCLFQIPWNVRGDQKLKKDTEVSLRIYFTKQSYIPIIVKVKYGKEHLDTNGQMHMQYGASFDKGIKSFVAIQNFIDFLYSFAEYSTFDSGDQKIFFL